MTLPLFQVDAFASRSFEGNPAAVCLLSEERDATWMQHVAAEMNLSETAFVRRVVAGYELRWFTPTTEVPLCGHATLATAHVLWESQVVPTRETIAFHTQSGVLKATGKDGLIWLDFPAKPVESAVESPALLGALGVAAPVVMKNERQYLIEVESEETVRRIRPDFVGLRNCCPGHGIIITSRSARAEFDFVSRYFAPAFGVDEDPVTGSAHCTLGPYWRERLGKDELIGYQASSRGGVVHVRVAGDRVYLGGSAITVLKGTLTA